MKNAAFIFVIMISVHAWASAEEYSIVVEADFDRGAGTTPFGWTAAGDTSMAKWDEHKTTQNRSLLIDDASPERYCEWFYDLGRIPEEALAAGKLFLSWDQRYNIKSGQMRMTALFFNGVGDIIDQKHWLVEGTSSGFEQDIWQSKAVELPLPASAAKIRFSMVSGGRNETTGLYYIDNFIIRSPAGAVPATLAQTGEYELVQIESWDMEQPDKWRPDCPQGWQFEGPIPYLARWCEDTAFSGKKSICIKDDDPRSNAFWSSYRYPLEFPPALLELSFAIKTEKVYGEWKITVAYYDIPVEHNYSPLNMRVDGIIKPFKNGIIIDWFKVMDSKKSGRNIVIDPQDSSGSDFMQVGQTKLKNSDKDKNGFWKVSARIPAYPDTKAYRIALFSGWDPASTGTVWLDDVSLSAIISTQKKESK
jgi:hypothetical protein